MEAFIPLPKDFASLWHVAFRGSAADSMMATCAGFRATPHGFYFAAVSGTRELPVLEDAVAVEMPKSYTFSDGLRFLQNEGLRLLQRHRPLTVAVRESEYARSQSGAAARERVRVEGTILVACSEAGCPCYLCLWASMSSRLGVKKAKALVLDPELRKLDWAQESQESREAIIAAVSVLP